MGRGNDGYGDQGTSGDMGTGSGGGDYSGGWEAQVAEGYGQHVTDTYGGYQGATGSTAQERADVVWSRRKALSLKAMSDKKAIEAYSEANPLSGFITSVLAGAAFSALGAPGFMTSDIKSGIIGSFTDKWAADQIAHAALATEMGMSERGLTSFLGDTTDPFAGVTEDTSRAELNNRAKIYLRSTQGSQMLDAATKYKTGEISFEEFGAFASMGAGVGAASSLLSNSGGNNMVSQTTTNEWRTPSQQNDANRLWNDFINSFYGVTETIEDTEQAPTGGEGETTVKSYKQRLEEDQAYLHDLENTYNTDLSDLSSDYMADTRAAISPYQDLLSETMDEEKSSALLYQDLLSKKMNEAETGTGMFTPVSFGFGGQQMASFVPRQNRELATQFTDLAEKNRESSVQSAGQMLGMGKEQMGVGVGLADLAASETKGILGRAFETGQEFTPNQIENLYAQKLQELMMLMSNKTGGTITKTAQVPQPSTWSNILSGVNTGLDIYKAISPSWSSAQATTAPTATGNLSNGYTGWTGIAPLTGNL